jgi:hypothetical protein
MDSSITSSPGNGDVKLQWHSKLETREEREKLLVYLVHLVENVELVRAVNTVEAPIYRSIEAWMECPIKT